MIAGMNEQARYGQLIRQAMAAKGMTQRDMAEITGWSQSVVSDIINGKRTLTPPEVVRTLASVLDLPATRQLIALGYVDPEEPTPGIAYAVPEESARATLLDAVRDAPDELIRLIANHAEDIIQTFGLARLGHSDYRDLSSQSIKDRSTNRSA